MTRTTPALRWYVALEPARPARLGAPTRESLMWGVYPTRGRDVDRNPIRVGRSTFFATMSAAIAYARRQMRVTYPPVKETTR